MNILITNDDGIDALGLKVLYDVLSPFHRVFAVAPSCNRSAVSHHINMTEKLKLHKISENQYSLSAYPADCVCVGLKSSLFSCDIDLVLSGINRGGNMGTDIIYSGTCAAARQAVLSGKPGIALSVAPDDWALAEKEGLFYKSLATFVAENILNLYNLAKVSLLKGAFVNVNAPSLPSYKGLVFNKELCKRNYGDSVRLLSQKNKIYDFETEFLPGEIKETYSSSTDAGSCSEGLVSITSVLCEPVCLQIEDNFLWGEK